MSRTTLCVLTAGALALVSLGVMALRRQVLGDEVARPAGPGTYRVSMVVRGKAAGEARVITACPLDFQRQHISHEQMTSAELTPRVVELRHGQRRQIQWTLTGGGRGPFEARYEFYSRVDVRRPAAAGGPVSGQFYGAPRPSEYLQAEPGIDPSHPDVCNLALELTPKLTTPADQVRAVFQYVDSEVSNEPGAGGPGRSAVECAQSGRGDAAAQSRLVVALCRNRGIPARLVHGLTLGRTGEQKAHVWAEAWVGYWMPLCPFHGHCGKVPTSYLVFGFGDLAMVRGHNIRNLDYAFLVEPRPLPDAAEARPSALRAFFRAVSLHALPPAERGLVEFLLLLPLAALIICVFRNVIGLSSFGMFAPALIGLAFRDLHSLPGLLVFVCIILLGWCLRRGLDRYHLLQVPRIAFLLSLVAVMLLTAILLANLGNLAVTRYFSLFPLVILTGMIERFWTLENEDSTAASFRTLLGTMAIAAAISLLLSVKAVTNHLCRYPETLGMVMAGQLLLGRYTGYRLTELFRFREFVGAEAGRGEERTSLGNSTVLKVVGPEVVGAAREPALKGGPGPLRGKPPEGG